MSEDRINSIKYFLKLKKIQEVIERTDEDIFNKEKIEEEREKIRNILEYLKKNDFWHASKSELDKVEDAIVKVVQLEIEELGKKFDPNASIEENDIILHLIDDENEPQRLVMIAGREENENGIYEKFKPILFFNWNKFHEAFESFFPDVRKSACNSMFKGLLHEIQHYRQFLMADCNISNKESLRYARDITLKRYLDSAFYSQDIHVGNYDDVWAENDADYVALMQYTNIMKETDESVKAKIYTKLAKKYLGMYRIDSDYKDKQSHFNSKGPQDRDDISDIILDELICKQGETKILQEQPILQKLYNLDGSKKTLEELIENMNNEKKQITAFIQLSDLDRQELIKSCEEMYFELIYRRFEKDDKVELEQAIEKFGKDYMSSLINQCQDYFNQQKENKVEKSKLLRDAKANGDRFCFPYNKNRVTQVEKNGIVVTMSIDELVSMMDQRKAQKKILYNGREKTLGESITMHLGRYIPPSGIYVLKDGSKMSVKDFIENKLSKQREIRFPEFFKENVMSEPDAEYLLNCERLEKYYGKKREVLDKIKYVILNSESGLKRYEITTNQIGKRTINAPAELKRKVDEVEQEEKNKGTGELNKNGN